MYQISELPFLANWQNFYIIIGTASATLTGLMFVVITLTAGLERHPSALDAGISAFITPAIVHFGVVLLTVAILSMPWQAVTSLSILLGMVGIGGFVYLIVVMRKLGNIPGRQTPVHDWVWYAILPLIPYIALISAAIMLLSTPEPALYLISAQMILLMFISIRNAWDLVTYFTTARYHAGE